MAALIVFSLLGLLFLILGVAFRRGKWLLLIAGYNTLPKAERDGIDAGKLGRLSGNTMLIIAALSFAAGGGLFFLPERETSIGLCFAAAVIAVAVVLIAKANRLKSS